MIHQTKQVKIASVLSKPSVFSSFPDLMTVSQEFPYVPYHIPQLLHSEIQWHTGISNITLAFWFKKNKGLGCLNWGPLTPWMSCCSHIYRPCACGWCWRPSYLHCSSVILPSASRCWANSPSFLVVSPLRTFPLAWCCGGSRRSTAPGWGVRGLSRTTSWSRREALHSWKWLLPPPQWSRSRGRLFSLQGGRWSSPLCRGKESGCRGTGPPPWSRTAATGPQEIQLLPLCGRPRL